MPLAVYAYVYATQQEQAHVLNGKQQTTFTHTLHARTIPHSTHCNANALIVHALCIVVWYCPPVLNPE